MPAESVVDALLKVHRALRPDGMLLDCHPIPEPVLLEIRRGHEIVWLDPLEYTPEFKSAIANADQAFSSLSNDGTFLKQQELQYEFLIHFDSVGEWDNFWADQAVYFVPPKDELFEKMHQQLARRDSELLFHSQTKATCFKKPAT